MAKTSDWIFIALFCGLLLDVGQTYKMGPAEPGKDGNLLKHKRDILFPDEARYKMAQHSKPNCLQSGKKFCTDAPDYPKDLIEKALSNQAAKYDELFGEDVISEINPNITNRLDVPGEEAMCTSTLEVIYPQVGTTMSNDWGFIVNHENYTQGIKIEQCLSPGKPCAMSDIFPNGYTTECRQKFIERQMVSINKEGEMGARTFQFPSCCVCILKTSTKSRRDLSRNH